MYRFVRSIKEKCLTKLIFVAQASLRRAIVEYMRHFHEERNHQGLDNRLIRERRVALRRKRAGSNMPKDDNIVPGGDNAYFDKPIFGADAPFKRSEWRPVVPAERGVQTYGAARGRGNRP